MILFAERMGRPPGLPLDTEAALEAMPRVEGTNGQLYLAQPLATSRFAPLTYASP